MPERAPYLRRLVLGCACRPRTVLVLGIALAISLAVLAAFRLETVAGRTELISGRSLSDTEAEPHGPGSLLSYDDRFFDYRREFGEHGHVYLVGDVEGTAQVLARRQGLGDAAPGSAVWLDAQERVLALARDFAARCKTEAARQGGAIEDVLLRFDASSLGQQQVLFAPLAGLQKLVDDGKAAAGTLQRLAEGPTALFASLAETTQQIAAAGIAAAPPARVAVLQRMLAGIAAGASATEPAPPNALMAELAPPPAPTDLRGHGYVTCRTPAGVDIFVLVPVMPRIDESSIDPVGPAIRWLRATLADVQRDHPDALAAFAGQTVLHYDEMQQATHDMTLATAVAIVLIAVLFATVYGAVTAPLLAMLAMLVGIGWTLGFITLAVGHLNLLSVMFWIILSSIGIDFGVHFVDRMREELRDGASLPEALRAIGDHTARAMVTGGLTTAAAFLTALAVEFRGLGELGEISGVGMLLVLLATLTMLPASCMLVRGRLERRRNARRVLLRPLLRSTGWTVAHPRVTLLGAVLVVGACAAVAPRVGIDFNLLSLLPQGRSAVRYERAIMERSDQATVYAVMVADDLDHLRDLRRRLRAHAEAEHIGLSTASVLDFPPDQARKIALLRSFGEALSPLPAAPVDGEAPRADPGALGGEVAALQKALGELADEPLSAELAADVAAARRNLGVLLTGLTVAPQRTADEVAERQAGRAQAIAKQVAMLQDLAGIAPIQPSQLPTFYRTRFVGRTGKLALQIYPTESLFDAKSMLGLVDELQQVDGNVTGPLVQTALSTMVMSRGFETAAIYALIAVFVLLLIDFRHLPSVLLSMVPLVVGLIILIGVMGLTGLSFNMANFFAIPILIGIGIDHGVHIVHRFRESRSADGAAITTGVAVAMTTATTVIGFLSIALLSRHRGLASFGAVLSIGITACAVVALWVLPPLLRVLYRKGLVVPPPRS